MIWISYINYLFLRKFFKTISENVVKRWRSGACYSSRHFNNLIQWECWAKVFVLVYWGRNGIFKFIWLFSLRINFPFWGKLILQSPRRWISLVLLSICWKSFKNVLEKSFAFRGLWKIRIAVGLTFSMTISKKKTCSIEFEKNILDIKAHIVSNITCNISTISAFDIPNYTVAISIYSCVRNGAI